MKIVAPLLLLALSSSLSAQVTEIACPNGGIQPRLQRTADGVLHLVYFTGQPTSGDLYYVRSEDDGATFGPALRVNAKEGAVDASGPARGGAIVVDASGGVHVAWLGAKEAAPDLVPEGRAILYSRLPAGAQEFEAMRHLSKSRLDPRTAPTLVVGLGKLYVFWHAEGEALAGASEQEPGRRVYMNESMDLGATFSDPRAVDDERFGVSADCGLSSTFSRKNKLYVMYRSRDGRDRNLRLLVSEDEGKTFLSSHSADLRQRRTVETTTAMATSTREPVVVIENDGLFWSGINDAAGRMGVPIAPRKKDVWRSRPTICANDVKAVILAWVEGDEEGDVDRIGWQIFDQVGRFKIDLGYLEGSPSPNTSPAVFARSDNGFTIVY